MYSKLQFNQQLGVDSWWSRRRDHFFDPMWLSMKANIQVFSWVWHWRRVGLLQIMATLAAGTWDVYPFGKETHLPNIHFWGYQALIFGGVCILHVQVYYGWATIRSGIITLQTPQTRSFWVWNSPLKHHFLGENPTQGSVIIQPYNPRHFRRLPCCLLL